MSTWAIFAPLFIINSHLRIQRLLRLSFVFITILGLNSLLITTTADNSSRTIVRAGTFGAAQEDDSSYGEAGRYAADGVTMAAVAFIFSRHILERILLMVNLAILGMMVQMSGARQAILGLMISCAYLFAAMSRLPGAILLIFKSVVALAVLGFCFVAIRGMVYEDDQLETQSQRLWSTFTDDGGGVLDRSHRSTLWAEGLDMWQKSPIIGNGLGALGWTHPHNFFVELLCDGGLIGFFIGTTVVAIPALLIVRGFLGGTGAYFMILSTFWLNHFAFSMVSGDVGQNRIVYTLSALIVSYCTDGLRRRNVNSPPDATRAALSSRSRSVPAAREFPSPRDARTEKANLSFKSHADKTL
ncbi:MAG: O-antigen ligase family protein [Planctomycetaceae bacterium]|nr:O-antigen ligase family protein [Planctomycetaceae bacterium]